MPAWYTHLVTANRIEKSIKVEDKDSFVIGNIMPDAEKHIVGDFSFYVPWSKSHYGENMYLDGVPHRLYNIDKFVKYHLDDLENPMILGYLTHLLTDEFWNKLIIKNYNLYDENGNIIGVKLKNGIIKKCNKEDARKIKHRDFAIIQEYLKSTKEYYVPKYNQMMLEYSKDIKEIPYKMEDLKKIIKYLEENNNINDLDYNYQLFNSNEIDIHYNMSIDYILSYFKKIGIKVYDK